MVIKKFILAPFLLLAIMMVLIALTVDFETDPVDATWADDPAFWQHPTDLSQSLILGTGKEQNASGNLVSFNLDGSTHQDISIFKINNVDVRNNQVCFSTREDRSITCLVIDPTTRLMDAASPIVISATSAIGLAYGFCMYESPGGLYGFVTDKDGDVEQYDLNSQALVRSFDVGTQSEGCVADDESGILFIGEENVAVWAYGAEPTEGNNRILVDENDPDGHFYDDVEGLALYKTGEFSGYLLASSQGSNEFIVYDRESPYAYIATFVVDNVTDSDGIEAINAALPGFPNGIFITHDDLPNPENFKIVDWNKVQSVIDGIPSTPTPTPTLTPIPPTPTPVPSTPTPTSTPQAGCTVTISWDEGGAPQTLIFSPFNCNWSVNVVGS